MFFFLCVCVCFVFLEPSQPYIVLKCICLVFDTFQSICVRWCLFVVPYNGNRKCLKQSFHYKINKDRELLQYMYIKIFVFYLPYIPKKNQQNNMSHAIATKTAKHFYWGHSIFHFYILFQRFCQPVSKYLSEIFSGCFWNEGSGMLPDMCDVKWQHFTECPKCILWELKFSLH